MAEIVPTFGMWATFAVILVALVLYLVERIPLALTSVGILCVLLVLFHVAPVPGADGGNILDAKRLLAGFSNAALIAVVALLVMGQGLAQTGVLTHAAGLVMRLARGHRNGAPLLALFVVLAVSGFLNNIPVVVIFIPVIQVLAERLNHAPSRLMMPLSFAAILGGMTTLIGSSTNLLVSGTLVELGRDGFGFFSFTVPGVFLALVGLVYVVAGAPRLMPRRAALTNSLVSGRQFIAQVNVAAGSKFDGMTPRGGFFPSLTDVTVRILQRGEQGFVPPFDESMALQPGDVLVVAATRDALTKVVGGSTGLLHAEDADAPDTAAPRGDQVLAEVMVTPSSRFIGLSLSQIGFRHLYHCIVLGIQRRSQMIRSRMTDIRLQAGDVLLVQGRRQDIEALRQASHVLLIEWSAQDQPSIHHAPPALAIFAGVIVAAATGVVPIVVAALCGAVLMIASGVLNIRQAARAIDGTLVVMIATALALGAALQETGGAQFVASGLLRLLGDAGPAVVLSSFFLLVAILANVISTKATAVLVTPIAVGIADAMGVSVVPFAVAVVFASNCAFASPVGYQTNLLIMAPGNYRFGDFIKAGAPLVIIVWIAFSLFAPWYYGLS